MLELRARFDEENNMANGKKMLEEEGVKVLVGHPQSESACQNMPDPEKDKETGPYIMDL